MLCNDIGFLPRNNKGGHFYIIKRGDYMKHCDTRGCVYNKDGVCYMYNEERSNTDRVYDFYKKWNPNYLTRDNKVTKPKIIGGVTYL